TLLSATLLYHSHAHCFLHSFPTRRSSDLFHRRVKLIAQQMLDVINQQFLMLHLMLEAEPDYLQNRVRIITRRNRFDESRHLLIRSEEHTSELQSRFDLVCRLLLEKKKKTS